MDLLRPLRPIPAPSLRPWAGTRLGGGVGELWVAGPASVVQLDDGRSMTLDELAASAGAELVGTAGLAMLGPRFPLLAKLIDAGDWLSLQVHPDDALARRLYGVDAVGKDEAWVVLEADPGARLVTGPRRSMDRASVMAAVAAGTMDLDALETADAVAGDAVNVRAGTIHAIGAGVFVYEIEEPSDITFRISDWGRPPTPGRHLHRDEAGLAVDPTFHAQPVGSAWRLDGDALNVRSLRLELVAGGSGAERTPSLRSPEIVTAFGGEVTLVGPDWTERLGSLETAVVPAAAAVYRVDAAPGAVALIGSLPR